MSADSIFPLIQHITPTVLGVGRKPTFKAARSLDEAALTLGLSRVPRNVPVSGAAATDALLCATLAHTSP